MSTVHCPLPLCDLETFSEVVSQKWEHFVNEVVRMMYAKTMPTVNRADAEDIVQTALAKAWEKRATYEPIKPLRNWLFVFVRWYFRNYLKDRARKYKSRGPTCWLEAMAENNSTPPAPDCRTLDEMLEKEAARMRHRAEVGRLLNGISKTVRQTIVKRHFRGMSISQIAREKSANEKTIAWRFPNGYRQMRQAGGQACLTVPSAASCVTPDPFVRKSSCPTENHFR